MQNCIYKYTILVMFICFACEVSVGSIHAILKPVKRFMMSSNDHGVTLSEVPLKDFRDQMSYLLDIGLSVYKTNIWYTSRSSIEHLLFFFLN